MNNKNLIPSEGKLAQFKKQLQPNVVVNPITNSTGIHKSLSLRKFTVLELTNTGYTMQFESNTTILFTQYPSESEILCISKDFVTTRLNGCITTWQFLYPTLENNNG